MPQLLRVPSGSPERLVPPSLGWSIVSKGAREATAIKPIIYHLKITSDSDLFLCLFLCFPKFPVLEILDDAAA